MYTANGKQFESFLKAIDYAKANNCDVVETATGMRRWTPGKVSSDAQRRYQERLNAYKAQQKLNKTKRLD